LGAKTEISQVGDPQLLLRRRLVLRALEKLD